MLGLGIVGCGRVTSMFHVKAIEQVPQIDLVAVSDTNLKRLNAIQGKHSVPNAYGKFPMMLSDEAVDAIAINTPPSFHEEMVLDSLDSGKHVICEKPLSTTVSGCQKIKKKMDKTKLVVLPAHNYSFTPGLYMMEELIAKDKIGSVTGMNIAFENNLKQYGAETDFRLNKKNGLIEDVLPHVLSIVQPILGYCNGVEDVQWKRKSYDICDNISAVLNTSSKVDVMCSMSWTKMIPVFSVEIQGEKGKLSGEFGLKPFTVVLDTGKETKTYDEKGISWYLDLVRFKHPSFQGQYQHFADLIENGGTPRVSIQDEINILETVDNLTTYLG